LEVRTSTYTFESDTVQSTTEIIQEFCHDLIPAIQYEAGCDEKNLPSLLSHLENLDFHGYEKKTAVYLSMSLVQQASSIGGL
jgi:hypothetical protein